MKGNKFTYYYLEYLSNKQVWNKYSQGSTFETINSKDIINLKLNVPSLEEQNKLSGLISVIDDKISSMEKNYKIISKLKVIYMKTMYCNKQNIP